MSSEIEIKNLGNFLNDPRNIFESNPIEIPSISDQVSLFF